MYAGERFNGITHLVGVALAAIGASVLVWRGAQAGDAWTLVGFGVYGAALVLLYAVSTLYHSTRGRARSVLRRLDHCAIYVLIAGTYTPFCLVTLRGPWGWTMLGLAWGLAAIGIGQESILGRGARIASVVIYAIMGWMGLIAIAPLAQGLGMYGIGWLLAGGILYTAGIAFYALDERVRHFHGVWHLFVLGGSVSHFIAIAGYIR